MDKSTPITVALVGAGDRSLIYASYALKHPDQLKVVAVAEPDPIRRAHAAKLYDIPAGALFDGYEALAQHPQLAHAVFNGTMDRMHFDSSLVLLRAGYHMLLEKPIAVTEQEVRSLIRAATQEYKRTVMICHVLRYAPFYQTIKRLLEENRIGRIIALHTSENVSYHHMATAFVRGRWNREEDSNPMLLAKCCHDLDIIAWLMSGEKIKHVSSFGSLMQFHPRNAPEGASDRCLNDCKVESQCQYSARALYLDKPAWGAYAWEGLSHIPNASREQKAHSLKTDNPYGRCVWKCDNDVVDHQTVIIEFANGATASHNMLCATARATRTIHIAGERGEIEGDLESGWIRLRTCDPSAESFFREEEIAIEHGTEGPAGHGGGDLRLVEDFVRVLRGDQSSHGATRIEDSLTGHLIAFKAEEARRTNNVIEVTL